MLFIANSFINQKEVLTMLLINKYTCPIFKKVSIQAHEIQDGQVIKSFNKMSYEDLPLFCNYKQALIVNVERARDLAKVDFIKIG